jgi:hypothetical protein
MPEEVVTPENVILGSRVRRGPNWKWEEQDGGGIGTITRSVSRGGSSIWVQVEWDHGAGNCYRIHPEHDLMLISEHESVFKDSPTA